MLLLQHKLIYFQFHSMYDITVFIHTQMENNKKKIVYISLLRYHYYLKRFSYLFTKKFPQKYFLFFNAILYKCG